MTIEISITQRIALEFGIDDVTALQRLFKKLAEYRKPAGFKNDGLDLSRQERDYLAQISERISTITTNTNSEDDE